MDVKTKVAVVPLYLQVRDLLAERISKGEWKLGTSLPNEGDLARELGVSSGTVRKALGLLEASLLVERRPGRGTYIRDHDTASLAGRFTKFCGVDGEHDPGDLEFIGQATGPSTAREREWLHIDEADIVLRTQRVRRTQGSPFSYEEAFLPLRQFPGLVGSVVGNYRLTSLAQRYGVHLGRGFERIAVAQANAIAASYLHVTIGAPLLRLDRVVHTIGDTVAEWRIALCTADGASNYSST